MVLNDNEIGIIACGGGFTATLEQVEALAQEVLELRRQVKDQRIQLNEKDEAEEKLNRIRKIVDDILEGA